MDQDFSHRSHDILSANLNFSIYKGQPKFMNKKMLCEEIHPGS